MSTFVLTAFRFRLLLVTSVTENFLDFCYGLKIKMAEFVLSETKALAKDNCRYPNTADCSSAVKVLSKTTKKSFHKH